MPATKKNVPRRPAVAPPQPASPVKARSAGQASKEKGKKVTLTRGNRDQNKNRSDPPEDTGPHQYKAGDEARDHRFEQELRLHAVSPEAVKQIKNQSTIDDDADEVDESDLVDAVESEVRKEVRDT